VQDRKIIEQLLFPSSKSILIHFGLINIGIFTNQLDSFSHLPVAMVSFLQVQIQTWLEQSGTLV